MLDVGCGPGTITVDFAARVAPAPVIGIDAAPGVIEVAEAERRRRGTANVEFRTADLYALSTCTTTRSTLCMRTKCSSI